MRAIWSVLPCVGYTYLLAIADISPNRKCVRPGKHRASAGMNQAADQVQAGTSPAIDGLRAQVELKTRQRELVQAKNNLYVQKLALARINWHPAPSQESELTDKSPYRAVRQHEAQ